MRTCEPFELTSTQQTVTVPITREGHPERLRLRAAGQGPQRQRSRPRTRAIPASPRSASGYAELKVEDAPKRLAGRREGRPRGVPPGREGEDRRERDRRRRRSPPQSEVTLWAVDYGVLSLTGYQTPDVLDSVYLEKALQVLNEDSRQRIISRRVLTPKGADEGGGGGADDGPGNACARTSACWRSGSARWRPTRRGRATDGGHAAGEPHHVPHHGRRGRQAVALRPRRPRDPHQQAGAAARRRSRAS